jgi:hypothetical protein
MSANTPSTSRVVVAPFLALGGVHIERTEADLPMAEGVADYCV